MVRAGVPGLEWGMASYLAAGVVVRRAAEGEREGVLGVVLLGAQGMRGVSRGEGRGVVRRFLEVAREVGWETSELWGAFLEGGECVAGGLVLPGAGGAGVLLVSPIPDAPGWDAHGSDAHGVESAGFVGRVIEAACGAMRGRLKMVQCLTEVDGPRAQEAALRLGGMERLAELVFMECSLEGNRSQTLRSRPRSASAWEDRSMDWIPWAPERRPLFEAAIEATYEGTLDCPGLRGVRTMAEVVEGHVGAGVFEPGMWRVVWDRGADDEAGSPRIAIRGLRGGEGGVGRPAGVLCVNRVPEGGGRGAFEVVYLGVSPGYRGLGLGGALLERAIEAAARAGGERVVLSVDAANEPALMLYRRFGFGETGRKVAWIRDLQRK